MLLGLPWFTAPAWAQLEPSPDAPPVSTAPAMPADNQSVATFHVNVNLVDVLFTVRNKDGELVPHLTKNDCSISEDKVPQTIKSFTAETNLPLTLGLLVDTSGSQDVVLPLEKEAGSEFLEHFLRPIDQAFVVDFDVNVDLLQDYTNSAHLLSEALNRAQINTAGGNGGGLPGLGGGTVPISDPKGTVLYDAIYQVSADKFATQVGRKAMIILTDAQDEGSDHNIQQAIAAAQRANAAVYFVLLVNTQAYMSAGMGYYGYSAAKRIADETGGRVINVGYNGRKLAAAFQQISDELRSEYIATYTPSNTKLDGTYRHIEVNCGSGMKVETRKGYYAPNAQSE